MRKCCRTCRNWEGEGEPPSCMWPEPELPYWASISTNGDRGSNYTTADDGRNCRTYDPVPEKRA